ncbi:HNH endonuclease [Hydrogenophaga sp. RAC07]|uniref:HNH endonuclease n=1 Tax=Hydrogenophaga sp. RAC07 TaxID=1842537 RepID=UPI00083D6C89|nr:HNH endonuclease [Hydrogenophaga sp. RAC07]
MQAVNASALRHRPIYGGLFGMGKYALATLPSVSHGLHSLHYLVIEPGPGIVLSIAGDKLSALASAREVLRATAELARVEAADREQSLGQGELWPPDAFAQPPIRDTVQAQVSRRRREIFDKCGGRCHYCSTPLRLDGKWHIEHAFPKALGGLDEITNLFAACVPCNLSKRDRTALEFVTQTIGGQAV